MSLLKNAIDSIVLGLEDYNTDDKRRLISCARNIFAGILLLFKHKLSEMSPENSDEVLIKQKVLPRRVSNGTIVWSGVGKKTVDVQQIKERFESLNVITDWERVKNINNFRNDIEHYYTNLSKDAIRNLLANSFIVIRNFISDELALDPRTELGNEAWNILVSVTDVYQEEKELCLERINSINWASESLCEAIENMICENCGSDLITVKEIVGSREDVILICKSCDSEYNYDEILETAIPHYFEFDMYLAYKEGGDMPLIICPECGQETYVYNEGQCLSCGSSFEHTCGRCGTTIMPEEIDGSGFCGWCSHMMNKDD